MAEDTVDHAASLAGLEPRDGVTRRLNIHGFHPHAERFGALESYGSDAPAVADMIEAEPGWSENLHPRLPARAGEVAWAVRREMARTVDDFLARRTRSLVLDARAAIEAAPRVADIMAGELGRDTGWAHDQAEEFTALARHYLP
jgi:glycerol-3-phosphate dehydrogenase